MFGKWTADVTLELGGHTLAALTDLRQQVRIPPGADRRVDFRVKVQASATPTTRSSTRAR